MAFVNVIQSLPVRPVELLRIPQLTLLPLQVVHDTVEIINDDRLLGHLPHLLTHSLHPVNKIHHALPIKGPPHKLNLLSRLLHLPLVA
jgi:hypothetical protein